MPPDPPISRRRAEAIKPFVDAALEFERQGLLADSTRYLGPCFSGAEWRELVDAFKPEMP